MIKETSGQNISVNDDENAFNFVDTSKVLTEASIIIGVVHHILRPDEWLVLRTIDWLQNLINVLLGAWIVGAINVITKLLIEHNSSVKIQKLEEHELWGTLAVFACWLIGLFIYNNRFNQKWKLTKVDRQLLVDDIDSKLRLKFNRNE